MPLTHNEIQIQWSTANSVSVAAGGNTTSDTFTLDATTIQASLQIKADNDGTPASGDTVDLWLQATLGDPDGSGANEYGTGEQDLHLGILDTNDNDPALLTVQIPVPLVGGRVYAVNNSGGRAITISAIILEQQSS